MDEWNEIRKDFPALRRFRYFYSASGGPMPRPVYDKAIEYYRSAMESGDLDWEANVARREEIRQKAAAFINASADEVEFVPSTAAAMNVIAGLLTDDRDVAACTLEFPDTTLPWLHRRPDCIHWIEPDDSGAVAPARMLQALSRPGIVATSHVQYSNGFRQDVRELGFRKGEHLLVVNATQSMGAFEVDVRQMGIDALACNSYKWLLAGYGCGLLYVRGELISQIPSPGVGWFAVEERDSLRNDRYTLLSTASRFNWGSPSFPAIFCLGAALDYLGGIGIERIQDRVLGLSALLAEKLSASGFRILSPLDPPGFRSGALLVALNNPAAVVSALERRGFLCTLKPEGMRVAVHFFNNSEDIERLVEALSDIVGP